MTTLMGGRIRSLAERLDGELLLPGEGGYDEARSVWNAMVDRRPQVIVRCAHRDDVSAAVRFAREHDLEIAVRCGGHSVLGLGVPDGGLMIDLTPMGGVRVDAARRRAWVQGGALLGAVDRATQPHGLATTAGNVSHTGVGGLTLGGGMGWLARQCGLACDNVTSFEVVTAEGDLVRANETENPDLFWGLRGGGGNFGIVTEFEFRLHAVGTQALIADFFFPVEDALPVLAGWRDLNATAPRQATFATWVGQSDASYLPEGLRGKPAASVGFVWVGDPGEGRKLLPSMRALGRPAAERIEEMPYLQLQCTGDSVEGHKFRRYFQGHYFAELPDDAIQAVLTRGLPDGHGEFAPSVSLQAYGGAITEVPDSETAFSQRDTLFEFVTATRWTDPAEDDAWMSAARRCAASLDRFASGSYVNRSGEAGADSVGRAYSSDKLTRLVALKDAYDPANVFHLNQNIPPSSPPRR
jgi:FAD/FMN-containing dehydrogenase